MLEESGLETVHRCAKTCIKHLVSLNRSKAAVGRIYTTFDQAELRKALDDGHKALPQVFERLTGPNVPAAISCCGVEAKCAHGVAFQLAEETLCRLADEVPASSIKWDRLALKNLYAALARELKAAERCHPNTAHSDCFTSVIWFGMPFSFSQTQASCIRYLWENWERNTPEVRGDAVAEAAGAGEGQTLPKIFTQHGKRHPAWGVMIGPGRLYKGTYRLIPADEAKAAQQEKYTVAPRKTVRRG